MSDLQIMGIVSGCDILVIIIAFLLFKKLNLRTHFRLLLAINAATLCNVLVLLVRGIYLALK